jgi:uncharacterized RDD family membrane protein YckC
LDLTAKVITPENIQFEYRIAGPFKRMPAFILDFIIRAGVLVGVSIAIGCSGVLSMLAIPASVGLVIVMMSYFMLDWFYGLFFETYWNGKTPGKFLTKIQVISADGRPISAYQATLRNFLRAADLAPLLSLQLFDPDSPPMYLIPTGLVAFFCMACTKRFQRLGDLAAGTMVVVDERTWVPPVVKFEDSRVESLAAYIPPGFRMSRTMIRAVALYVERRNRIGASRRLELASILAKPLMQRFGFRSDTSADLLLCALYYREIMLKQVATPGVSVLGPSVLSTASPMESPQVVAIAGTRDSQGEIE